MAISTLKRLLRKAVKLSLNTWPFLRGPGRIGDSMFCRYLTNEGEVVATELWRGPKIFVQLNDYCGRMIYFAGALDRKVDMLCPLILRDGDTVVDIGGNYGAICLRAASLVGPRGRVHCFEPQPDLVKSIGSSVALNGFNNISLYSLALSNNTGTADFGVPQGNCGMASLNGVAQNAEKIQVPVFHAGEYLSGLNLAPIRMLKIDVEGHEEVIFRAAGEFLRDSRPQSILFESHDVLPFMRRPVVQILRELEYQFFQVSPDSWMNLRLLEIRLDADVKSGSDFVALTSDLAEELRPFWQEARVSPRMN